MSLYIEPRLLKGFRDFLPAQEIERRLLSEKVEEVFRSFGFVPIDTPALEYTEILLGKSLGETEKQIYRFKDHGKRDVALRFDLTVPFARYMAAHRAELPIPFKRYHIAKVWRGENTQRGRYREFTQCDFDIVGTESLASDLEILLMIYKSLTRLGAGEIRIHVNHRGLFNQFLDKLEIKDKSTEILRTVDKRAKIGEEELSKELAELCGGEKATSLISFITPKDGWKANLDAMVEAIGETTMESERLSEIYTALLELGIAENFYLDPSITRGLDYYTGLVFETFLKDLPDIGSVCSGGRYDDLAGLYSKEPLSGIGASIGLDRLLAALEALGKQDKKTGFAPLAIACMDENLAGQYQKLAEDFRAQGLATLVLSEKRKSVQQYTYAEKMGAALILIADAESLKKGLYTIRNLSERKNYEDLSFEEVLEFAKKYC